MLEVVYTTVQKQKHLEKGCVYINTEIQTLKEVVYTKKKQRKSIVYHYFETQTIREDGEFYYPFRSTFIL